MSWSYSWIRPAIIRVWRVWHGSHSRNKKDQFHGELAFFTFYVIASRTPPLTFSKAMKEKTTACRDMIFIIYYCWLTSDEMLVYSALESLSAHAVVEAKFLF